MVDGLPRAYMFLFVVADFEAKRFQIFLWKQVWAIQIFSHGMEVWKMLSFVEFCRNFEIFIMCDKLIRVRREK